jgi:single-stranded-DNA-specific exonuclease
MSDADECRAFLSPKLDDLHHPASLPDIAGAAAAVAAAVRDGKGILVYGDYDADGTTGAALLARLFRLLGQEADVYIPRRLTEGYGVNVDAAKTISASKPGLVVTVDCGTSDCAAIEILRNGGADVVVIDHHEAGEQLADALVVNPKRPGSKYPFRDLAGVGVAFKTAWAVAEELSPTKKVSPEVRQFLLDSLALVAIGTVADVVPLIGENRILTAFGLCALESTKDVGLTALLRSAGVGGRKIKAHDIAFRVAPRLNAAGRIEDAMLGLRLLTTSSPDEARRLAKTLDDLNTRRQRLQEQTVQEANELASQHPDAAALVLARPGWHVGVVGVAASKVLESRYVPAVLLAVEGETARGSARSVPGFNIYEAFEKCDDLLVKWGGHALAAGLTLEVSKIDAFAERLDSIAREAFDAGKPEPILEIDAEVTLAELDIEAARGMERLAPFGSGNRRPVLTLRGAKVAGSPQRMGARNSHMSFHLAKEGSSLRAVWWNSAGRVKELRNAKEFDAAFSLRIDTWSGRETVELDIKDLVVL